MKSDKWIRDTLHNTELRMELNELRAQIEQWAHELREKGLDAEEVYVMIDQTIDDAVEDGQWKSIHRALAGLYLDRWIENAE